MLSNKAIIFKQVPDGIPIKGKDLVLETRDFDADSLPAGGLSYKVNYVSFDPVLRILLRNPSDFAHASQFRIGDPVCAFTISTVLTSDSPDFEPGQVIILAYQDVAQYGYISKQKLSQVTRLTNPYNLDPKLYLGALGMPGLSAYASLHEIGKPQKGEVLFVSSAAGAVGQLVGQIAKNKGLTVIGSVGSDEKVRYVTEELGFDYAFNYKKEKPGDALKRIARDGIDIYFDNVGAEHLEAALDSLKLYGRIVACGMISQYNVTPTKENPDPRYGVKNLMHVVLKRITFRGFNVSDPDIGPKWKESHKETVEKWLSEGSFKYRFSTFRGIENGIDAFLTLFDGKNQTGGKVILEVDPLKGWEGK